MLYMRQVLTLTAVAVAIAGILLATYIYSKKAELPSTPSTAPHRVLVIKGSDTLVPMVSELARAFMNSHPNTTIVVQSGHSAAGIQALIDKQVDFIDSSRPMNAKEVASAKTAGLQVQEFVLALDAVAVIVNPNNTLTNLSFKDLGSIYATNGPSWKKYNGQDATIRVISPPDVSGTNTFFHDTVMGTSSFSGATQYIENFAEIVAAVNSDKNAIAYVGVGYARDAKGEVRPGLKVLSIGTSTRNLVSPLDETLVRSGRYPLARPLYQYTATLPDKDSLAGEFLRFELSDQGQGIIRSMGFYTANPDRLSQDRTLLGI